MRIVRGLLTKVDPTPKWSLRTAEVRLVLMARKGRQKEAGSIPRRFRFRCGPGLAFETRLKKITR